MTGRSWRFTDRAKRIAWTLATLAIVGFGVAADLSGVFLR